MNNRHVQNHGSVKCPKCNKEVPEDAKYCPYCGSRIINEVQKIETQETRPTIVVATAILFFVLGVLNIIGGAIVAAFSPLLPYILGPGALAYAAVAVIAIVFGFLDIITGLLLWNMKKSGFYIGLSVVVVGILLSPIKLPGISNVEYLTSFAATLVIDVLLIMLLIFCWKYLR